MTRTQRCEDVRTRVEDWLEARGASNSWAARQDAQRLFVRRAIRAAKDRGITRFWKPGPSETVEDAGLKSLKYLLKEKSCTYKGRTSTGGNQGWVLDLWEAALSTWSGRTLTGSELAGLEAHSPGADGLQVFTRSTPADERTQPAPLLSSLQPWLSSDYCSRCDSFGHTEERASNRWCNVCWDTAKPLPYSLRQFISTGLSA